jgi:hypothetical protein
MEERLEMLRERPLSTVSLQQHSVHAGRQEKRWPYRKNGCSEFIAAPSSFIDQGGKNADVHKTQRCVVIDGRFTHREY